MKNRPLFHVDASQINSALQTGQIREVVHWPSGSMWPCPVDAAIQVKADREGEFEVRGIENLEHLFDITPRIPRGEVLLGVRKRISAKRFTTGPAILRAMCTDVKAKRVRLQSPERPMPIEPARWVWIYSFEDLVRVG